MRHGNHTFKVGRTGSHRRCMLANMMKSLIENGRISEKRLEESLKRILTVKYERGILIPKEKFLDPEKTLGNEEHLAVVSKILEETIKLIMNVF